MKDVVAVAEGVLCAYNKPSGRRLGARDTDRFAADRVSYASEASAIYRCAVAGREFTHRENHAPLYPRECAALIANVGGFAG